MWDIVHQASITPFRGIGPRVAVCGLLLCLSACAVAGGANPAPSLPPVTPQLTGMLPAPATLHRVSDVTGVVRWGREFEPGLPHNLTQAMGDSVKFSPAYINGASPLTDLAYAIYSFDLQDFSGPQQVQCTWDFQADFNDAWLGLANFSHNRWDWFRVPAAVANVSTFGVSLADYTRATDHALFAATVLTGEDPWLLLQIQIGGDAPPAGWMHSWGATAEYSGYTLALDPGSGNLMFGGETQSYGAGGRDVALLAYGADGTLLTQKTWGTSASDAVSGMIFDGSGNLYICGYTSGATEQNSTLLMKFNNTGEVAWSKAWGLEDSASANAVAIADDGSVYCLATMTRVVVIDSTYISQYDLVLLKFTPDGNLEWQKTWDGLHGDSFGSIAIDPAGGCYLAGNINYFDLPGVYACLLKFNASGSVAWAKVYTHASGDTVQAFGVKRGANGHLYLAGCMYQGATDFQALLVETAADGAFIRACGWDGPAEDVAYSVGLEPSGVAHLVGASHSFDVADNADGLVVSIDAGGGLLSAHTLGAPGSDEALWDAVCDALGRLYCVGPGTIPSTMVETAVSGTFTPVIALQTSSEATAVSNLTGTLVDVAGNLADCSGITDAATGSPKNIIALQREY
jgi:hypothetical protein